MVKVGLIVLISYILIMKKIKKKLKISKNKYLSPKRENFCQELMVDENQTKAAIRAGFAVRSAEQQASRLMLNDKVKVRVEELRRLKVSRQERSADDLLKILWEDIETDLTDIISLEKVKHTVTDHYTGAEKDIITFGLLGKKGGILNNKCDLQLVVPGKNTDRIQEIHITVLHIIIEVIERILFPENYLD